MEVGGGRPSSDKKLIFGSFFFFLTNVRAAEKVNTLRLITGVTTDRRLPKPRRGQVEQIIRLPLC